LHDLATPSAYRNSYLHTQRTYVHSTYALREATVEKYYRNVFILGGENF